MKCESENPKGKQRAADADSNHRSGLLGVDKTSR